MTPRFQVPISVLVFYCSIMNITNVVVFNNTSLLTFTLAFRWWLNTLSLPSSPNVAMALAMSFWIPLSWELVLPQPLKSLRYCSPPPFIFFYGSPLAKFEELHYFSLKGMSVPAITSDGVFITSCPARVQNPILESASLNQSWHQLYEIGFPRDCLKY